VTTYRITLEGSDTPLYRRRETKAAVYARAATEKQDVRLNGAGEVIAEAIEAQPTVRYEPAEYAYTAVQPTFIFESDEVFENGQEMFRWWTSNESDFETYFNVTTEKATITWEGQYTSTFSFSIDAETAADEGLTDEDSVRDYVESNTWKLESEEEGDVEIQYVENSGDEFIEVEWL
jgi:hypothetical protein